MFLTVIGALGMTEAAAGQDRLSPERRAAFAAAGQRNPMVSYAP